MTLLSSLDAAAEGFRVIRREPRAVFVWGLLWLVWFCVTAAAIASGRRVEVSNGLAHWTVWRILSHFGPYALVLIGLFFLVSGVTAIATFRAVLQPQDRQFFYLRLGRDEVRVAAISLMAFSLVAIFGSAPSVVLIAFASPIMAAAPALARDIAELGAWVTVALEVWLCVRFSLIAVETFAEHRFHLTAYWPLTRGRFWYLLWSYAALFVIMLGVTSAFLVLTGLVSEYAKIIFVGGGFLRRTSLLGIAAILAVLSAGYWVFSLTMICACQAHAYRAITTTRPWG
jgi:hypothetical protein